MHGPGASNSGGAGGEAKWKNTEILTSEGGPAPPGPPIVGNPVFGNCCNLYKVYNASTLITKCLASVHSVLFGSNLKKISPPYTLRYYELFVSKKMASLHRPLEL